MDDCAFLLAALPIETTTSGPTFATKNLLAQLVQYFLSPIILFK